MTHAKLGDTFYDAAGVRWAVVATIQKRQTRGFWLSRGFDLDHWSKQVIAPWDPREVGFVPGTGGQDWCLCPAHEVDEPEQNEFGLVTP